MAAAGREFQSGIELFPESHSGQEASVGDNVKGLTKIQDNNICLCLAIKILNKFISCNQKCFDRKPCCTGVKILFFSEKWDIICLQIMCSSNLAQTHVRDIGL